MTVNELWGLLMKCAAERNGKFPTIETFASYTKLSYETISKVYARWHQEGKLIRNGNYYDFPNNKKIALQTVSRKSILDKVKSNGFDSLNPKEKTSMILIGVKALMAVVGFIMIGVSIHFTFNFNSLTMNKFWGFLLSVGIVIFTSFAFTVKSYMSKKSTKIAIVILWTLGIIYSVFTAVASEYNNFRSYSASDTSSIIINQKDILTQQLETAQKKQEQLQHWRIEEAEYTADTLLKVKNPGTWKSIKEGVLELSKVEIEIVEIQNKLMENISVNNVEHKTIYKWLSEFLHINADILQFIVVLFPALFIDLCSSICLAFAFGKD